MLRIHLLLVFLLMATALPANAGIIDFEKTAFGVTPTDNLVMDLSDYFMVDDIKVSFGFDTDDDGVLDANAVFEQSGNTDAGEDTGFWGIGGARDIAAPGFEEQLGDFFLRQSDPYQPFGVFTILYDSNRPVTSASGEIWDIDGSNRKTEQFLVQAFDEDLLLGSIESPLGNNSLLDGKPWRFSFEELSNINRIEITFTGSKTKGIGLAFDNFYPLSKASEANHVVEPDTFLVWVFVVLFVLFKHRSKKEN